MSGRLPDMPAIAKFDFDPIDVAKRLFNFFKRNVPFGMIDTEMPAIGSIPDDRPIVHPFSISEMDGQIGVASGI